jgi:hypothetical protein
MDSYMAEDLLRWRRQSDFGTDDDCVFASETVKGKQPKQPEKYRVFVPLALVAATAIPAIAQDASARTVQHHSQDIVPIRAKLKYTTLIEVPPTVEDHGSCNRR